MTAAKKAPPAVEGLDADLFGVVQINKVTKVDRLIFIPRVSQVKGRKGPSFMSVDEQTDTVERWAADNGAEVIDTRPEMDVSGGSVDRTVLQGALRDVLAGRADGIIVATLDRYARTTDGLAAIRTLNQKGKAFIAVKEGIEPSMTITSTGWLLLTILLALAEFQLRRFTEGWEATRARHIAAGVHTQVPYGYRKRDKDEVERPRQLEPDPVTAKWVRYMFKRRAAGASWIGIARELDGKGVAPPGGGECWLFNRVMAIVGSRVYLGEIRSGDAYVNTKAHKAIVTVELWELANAKKQTPARGDREPYVLTGLVRCATCGGRMVGFIQSVKNGRKRDGQTRKYTYYRCRRNYSWGRCPAPAYAPAGELEQLVIDEFMVRFVHALEGEQTADDRSAELDAAQEIIDEANADYDLFVNSPATKRTARTRGQEWYDAEVEKLNDALEAAQAAWQEIRNSMSGLDLPADLALRWPKLPLETRRGFLSDGFGVVAVRSSGGRRVPVAERVRIWAREEAGSPAARLPGRDTGISVRVAIKF